MAQSWIEGTGELRLEVGRLWTGRGKIVLARYPADDEQKVRSMEDAPHFEG